MPTLTRGLQNRQAALVARLEIIPIPRRVSTGSAELAWHFSHSTCRVARKFDRATALAWLRHTKR